MKNQITVHKGDIFMKHTVFISALLVCIALSFTSCYTPSPLYGTWADNRGSKITFMDDSTYSATIVATNGTKTLSDGTWSVLENVLVFSKNSGTSIDTEWDIRGSMLYLEWTDDDGNTQSLTLYHTAK